VSPTYELSAIIIQSRQFVLGRLIFNCLLLLSCLFLLGCHRLASINDDHFDGNIFCSLWRQWFFGTAKVTLAKSLAGTDQRC